MKIQLRKLLACALSLLLLTGSLPAPQAFLSGTIPALAEAQQPSGEGDSAGEPSSGGDAQEKPEEEPQPEAPSGEDRSDATSAPNDASDEPTDQPEVSADEPTAAPDVPTDEPTAAPVAPSDEPTATPDVPTDEPTVAPDVTPDAFIAEPSVEPTLEATEQPALIAKSEPTTIKLLNEEDEEVTRMTFDLGEGFNTFTLTAEVVPADTPIKWSISKTKIAAIAVDKNHPNVCTVTAKKTGGMTITATAADGSKVFAACAVTIVNLVDAVEIKGADTMPENSKLALTTALTPANAANKSIAWSIPDESDRLVASIDAKGVVTARNVDTPTTITVLATAKDAKAASDTHDIEIVNKVDTITLSLSDDSPVPATVDMCDDPTLVLKADVDPDDAAKTVTWYSTAPKIARIAADGTITFLKTGSVSFTAKATDGSGISASTEKITVTALANEVSIKDPGVIPELANVQLSAAVSPAATANKAVTWAIVSGSDYASIDAVKGVLKAKNIAGPGRETVTVTATAKDGSGVSGTIEIEIAPMADLIAIEEEDGSAVRTTVDMNENDTLALKAIVSPEEGAIQKVTWACSDKKTARISADGIVTFLMANPKPVTFTATATDGTRLTGRCTITVTAISKEVRISGPDTIPELSSVQLTAQVLPAATTNKAIQWSVDPDDVASVSAKGVLTTKAVTEPVQITVTAETGDLSPAFGIYRPWIVPKAETVKVVLADDPDAELPIQTDMNESAAISLEAQIEPGTALQNVTWISSNPKLAKFTAPGELALLRPGRVTITAAATDGSGARSTPWTFTIVALSKEISINAPATLTAGKSAALTAMVTPASTINKAVTWSFAAEEDATFARIDAKKGTLLANANLTETVDVTVIATPVDGGAEPASRVVTLLPKSTQTDILLNYAVSTGTTVYLNGPRSFTLVAVVNPDDAAQGVIWQTTNKSAASIAPNGLECVVTAKKAGKATISAIPVDGGPAARFSLVVKAGTPASVIGDITPNHKAVLADTEGIDWSFTGQEDVTYTADVFKDGDLLADGLVPTLTDSKYHVSYLPVESGVYQLRVTGIDEGDNEVVRTGGNVTAFTMKLTKTSGDIALGGVTSGKYATFGPDRMLPAGVSMRYDGLSLDSGNSVTLTLGAVAANACAINYQELGTLGVTSYHMDYTLLYDGGSYSADAVIEAEVVEENSLPTAIDVTASTFTGVAGTDMTFDISRIRLAGGALLTGDLEYVLSDEDGEIGEGLTVEFDKPGRYPLTLTGTYFDSSWSCPVTAIVSDAETEQPFEISLDSEDRTLYTGNVRIDVFALLTTTANLEANETLRWTMSRIDQNTRAVANLTLKDATGATNSLMNGWATGTGTVTFRITATSTKDSDYRASLEVTLTLAPNPSGLPTSIEYTKGSQFTLPVGGCLRVNWADIEADTGDLPASTTFTATYGKTSPTTAARGDATGADIPFESAGAYVVKLTARLGNLVWSTELTVTVDNSIHFPVLTGTRNELTLYAGVGAGAGDIGRVTVDPAYIEGSKVEWDASLIQGAGAVDVLKKESKDSRSIDLSYVNLGGPADATLRVSCTVNGATEHYDIAIHVQAAPGDLPDRIRYALGDGPFDVAVNETATHTYHVSDIVDENGDPLPNGMTASFDVPASILVSRETNGDVTVRYPENGRYVIGIAATMNNITLKDDFAVIAGDGSDEIALFKDLRITEVYPSGEDGQHVGTIFADNLVLKEGEDVQWTIDRSGSDAVGLAVEDNSGDFYANLQISGLQPVEADETAHFTVNLLVSDSYRGSIEFDLTVKAQDPSGMPTGLNYMGAKEVTIAVGGSVVFDLSDFKGVGAALPADFWTDLYNMPDSCEEYGTAGARVLIFHEPGRFLITPAAGYQNFCWAADPVAVNVGEINSTIQMKTDQQITTAYLDSGIEEGYFGRADIEGAALRDGEQAEWTLERLDGGATTPIELTLDDQGGDYAQIGYSNLKAAGTVTYLLRYEALGGRYHASHEFTVTVEAMTPEGSPDGCAFAEKTIELQPGESHFFARSDIHYTLDGVEIADPAGDHRSPGFWLTDAVSQLDWNTDDAGLTVTFPDPGRYVIFAAAFYGNYVFESPIIVLVKDAEHPALRIEANLDYSELYKGARSEGPLGSVRAVNFGVEDGTACEWSIERTDANGGDPVTLEFSDTDGAFANLYYRLGKDTGDVTYRITLNAEGMTATTDVSLSVLPLPDGLPTGISLPCATAINLDVGGTLAIDFDQITFASGTVPAGYEDKVWKDVWTEDGRWGDDAYWYHNGETNERVFVFNKAGRYLLRAGIGVCNHAFAQPITVVVREGNTGTLDPELRCDQRFDTAYLDSETNQSLAFLWVENVALGDDQEDYHWSFEKTAGPEGVAEIFEREDGNGPYDGEADFRLLNGTGTVTYRVTYTALNNLYQGSCDITLTVMEHKPDGLPTAITLPQTEFAIQPGESVDLDLNAIGYEGGTISEDVPVWKEIWNSEGRWESVEEDWPSDDIRRNTFPNEGVYYADVVLGVGNYMLTKTIKVIVKGTDPIDPELNVYQRFTTAYLGGEKDQNLGYVNVDNVSVHDGEWDDFEYQWEIVPVGTENKDIAELTLEGEGDPNGVGIFYTLGEQAGTVTYDVRYTGAGGLYTGSAQITLTVEEDSPAAVPTGITGIQTLYSDVAVNGSVSLNTEDIQPVGVDPETVGLWREFWNGEGNWGDTEENWEDSVRTNIFHHDGVYYVDAVCGIGNCFVKQRIKIVVKDGEAVNPGLNPYQRFTTAYLGGEKDQNLGCVNADNVTVPDGEWESFDYEWEIVPVGTENKEIAELTLEGEGDPRGVGIHYLLGEQAGTVTYEVRYTGAGGLYGGSVQITLTVEENSPAAVPTGITGIQTLYPSVAVNGSVSLNTEDIQPVGVDPETDGLWREFWNGEGNWGDTEENWEDSVRTNIFYHEGVYYVDAVCGIGNCFVKQRIKIVVKDGEAVSAGLNPYQRFTTAYLGGEKDQNLGYVSANNVTVPDGEWESFDYEWEIVPVGTENKEIAELTLEGDGDPRGVGIHYLLGEQAGTVKYEVRYTGEGGLYKGSAEFSLTVSMGLPANLPTGIQVPNLQYMNIPVNGSVTLDIEDIQPLGGTAPSGARVWRAYWNAEGDWGRTEEIWEDSERTTTFRAPGRYFVEAVYGVDNYVLKATILIFVGMENDRLPVTVHNEQRFVTAYLDGEETQMLSSLWVENVTLRSDEQEDFQWSFDKIAGDDGIVEIAQGENSNNPYDTQAVYTLKGGTGQVTYHVTYRALDNLYEGGCDITLNVVAHKPDNLPTGISLSKTEFEITRNGSVELDLKDIEYVGGSMPTDVTVWKEFWNAEGDWGSVQEDWPSDGVRRNTFPNEGLYYITVACGVGNYIMTKLVTIVVKDGDYLNPDLNENLRFTTAYLDGETDQYLGSVNADGVIIRDGEWEDFVYNWTIVPLDEDASIATLSLEGEGDPRSVGIHYVLGTRPGIVHYEIGYTANGLYQGTVQISLTVQDTLGVTLPDEIDVAGLSSPVLLRVDDTLPISKNAIQPVGEFQPPVGAVVYRDFWQAEGNWEYAEGNGDESTFSNVFREPGRYFFDAVYGIGNCMVKKRYEVRVTRDGVLIRSASFDQIYQNLYTSVTTEGIFGYVHLDGITLSEGESSEWTVEQVNYSEPAAFKFGVAASASDFAVLVCTPNSSGSATGDATFRIHYTVGDVYDWSRDFTVTIVDGTPAVVPTGIDYLYKGGKAVTVGAAQALDSSQITFVGVEVQPEGDDVWRRYSSYSGDFDAIRFEQVGGVDYVTFTKPGTYTYIAQAGIGNLLWEDFFSFEVTE